jgi:uncharacterized protein YprB with RNaseH-like and TPR domain
MLENIIPENILFLDVETVPLSLDYEGLSEEYRGLWDKKSAHLRKPEQPAAEVYERAGIYAEFGRIVCISAGYIVKQEDGRRVFRVKSFYDDDEKLLLEEFGNVLRQFYKAKRNAYLCAHNGKEFDFPYIARRMLVNGVQLPQALNIHGQKPWETSFLDTMELWRFGDYKNFTSLELLSTIFGIPSPKDDIDGSMVSTVYYKEKNLQRIVDYCEKDVLTVARLFLKLRADSCEISEVVRTAAK